MPRTAAVIGAPGQFGQPYPGTSLAPRLLREAGLHKSLAALGWRVEDMGDVVRRVKHTSSNLLVDLLLDLYYFRLVLV